MASEPPRHHLAAILNGDVVGYSRLVALDEENVVRALAACHAIVQDWVSEHHGSLADFTGDNFLAEFPSALDAVECALAIRQQVSEWSGALPEERRILFRLGVHLGDLRTEGPRLFGSGVNVAARLQALAEPGEICVSAPVMEQLRGRLELDVEDLGSQTVKNIPEPVHAFQVRGSIEATHRAHPAVRRRRWIRASVLGAAGLFLALMVGAWASWPLAAGLVLDGLGLGLERQATALPAGRSLAVLPFRTLGEDVADYLAEGLTEDLTTDLYGIPDLLVVSRNSAFGYQGTALDLREVGRALAVRYLLQGSVRGVAGRIRVTASLTDATTSLQIWSNRYDRVPADILVLQAEISEEILAALNVQLDEAERTRIRRKPTSSLTAYEAVTQANAEFYLFQRGANLRARALYERAIELDPTYAEAFAFLANTFNYEYTGGWTQDPRLLDQAETLVLAGLEQDPLSPQALAALTAVHIAKGRWSEAVASGERSVELAPSYDFGNLLLAMAYGGNGRQVAALQTFRRARRLDPRGQAPALAFLADLHYRAGRVEEAVATWEQIRRENPHHIATRLALAEHYEQRGRTGEAAVALRELLEINPDYRADLARGAGGQYLDAARTRWLAAHLARLRAERP